MRVEPNMMLRGSVWNFRMAVPKALRDLREQAGQPPGPREIWRSLGTGDAGEARTRLAEAKATLLREFQTEIDRLAGRARVVPSNAQLESAVFAFKAEERAALQHEWLHRLPTGRQVRKAQEQAFLIDQSHARGEISAWDALLERLDADVVIGKKDALVEQRKALRQALLACLPVNEFDPVDWAIQDIAERHGYLIEPDDDNYRILGTLLTRAWIQELDAADSVVMNLDIPAMTANLFRQGHLEQVSVNDGVPMVAVEAAKSVPAERDILKLFETYLGEQKASQSSSAEAESRRTMQQLVELSGISDVTAYRKAHITAYKKAMQQLPPNATRDYPGKSITDIIKLMPKGAPTLKAKTINSRLSVIAVFGKWLAETVDDVSASNFVTAPLPVAGTSDKMKPFTDAEVCSIFLSPTFVGCEGERNQAKPGTYRVRDYRFWLPILAAYTGCRLNELTQLSVDDIIEHDGIWALNITDAGDSQSLKTQQSRRTVPIHGDLVKLGFVERLKQVKAAGAEFFFHDITVDRQGRRSETAGKRFRKYLARLGVKGDDQRGGMHRFRHTVVEKLRSSGLFDHEIAPIVGHQTTAAPMTRGYGSSAEMTLKQRNEVIQRIRYEGLDLSLLV